MKYVYIFLLVLLSWPTLGQIKIVGHIAKIKDDKLGFVVICSYPDSLLSISPRDSLSYYDTLLQYYAYTEDRRFAVTLAKFYHWQDVVADSDKKRKIDSLREVMIKMGYSDFKHNTGEKN